MIGNHWKHPNTRNYPKPHILIAVIISAELAKYSKVCFVFICNLEKQGCVEGFFNDYLILKRNSLLYITFQITNV